MHQHYLEGDQGRGGGEEEQVGGSYPRSNLFTQLLSTEQYWSLSRYWLVLGTVVPCVVSDTIEVSNAVCNVL